MEAAFQRVYGGPDVLEVRDVAAPTMGDRDVRVQVRASPVTFGDRRLRAADFPPLFSLFGRLAFGVFGPRKPVPGTMFAGRVVAVGSRVTRFAVGDDVFGASMGGAYAEELVMLETGPIARMPAGASYPDAATLPYGAGTALYFLRTVAGMRAGQRVLIVGAAGGVGDFGVQVAKALGGHVTAVCARRSFDRMRAIGADAVFDYASEDFTRGDATWDVVFDTSGRVGFGQVRRVLTERGVFVTVEMTSSVLFHWFVTAWFGRRKARGGGSMPDAAALTELGEMLARGALRPNVRTTVPLREIARAHEEVDRRGVDGAVVVTVGRG